MKMFDQILRQRKNNIHDWDYTHMALRIVLLGFDHPLPWVGPTGVILLHP